MTLPDTMRAMVTVSHGDLDRIVLHRDWPRPDPAPGEVLIRVGACGLNNTDVNTRTGWYSKAVSEATTGSAHAEVGNDDPTWGGAPIAFPRIQGADVAGHIVAVGRSIPTGRVGERVIVEPVVRDPRAPGDRSRIAYLGSERDGGFAEYVAVPAVSAFRVQSDLSDAELATFPCSYSTAEHMLTRIRLSGQDVLLVTGASGGVGSALVQLAKRRGATVLAIAGVTKMKAVAALGADRVIPREANMGDSLKRNLPEKGVDAVADVVGGSVFPDLVNALKPGGRYVTAGAIAGPIVSLDLRQLYLKDLEFQGATVLPPSLFGRLVAYIEKREIRPVVAGEFPLSEIMSAQEAFMAKKHVGSFVLRP